LSFVSLTYGINLQLTGKNAFEFCQINPILHFYTGYFYTLFDTQEGSHVCL